MTENVLLRTVYQTFILFFNLANATLYLFLLAICFDFFFRTFSLPFEVHIHYFSCLLRLTHLVCHCFLSWDESSSISSGLSDGSDNLSSEEFNTSPTLNSLPTTPIGSRRNSAIVVRSTHQQSQTHIHRHTHTLQMD